MVERAIHGTSWCTDMGQPPSYRWQTGASHLHISSLWTSSVITDASAVPRIDRASAWSSGSSSKAAIVYCVANSTSGSGNCLPSRAR